MAEVGLQLHPDKTKIVYCKDLCVRASTLTALASGLSPAWLWRFCLAPLWRLDAAPGDGGFAVMWRFEVAPPCSVLMTRDA